ncbi:hypothetical protein [Moritella yayanosii]|uniref:Lipoprotein n=1 Tax=Moritella yayanosii TaxID=69539 RepID=A0A330LR43_9GAMM|nr:hypothetical protein [Moritella yayanosii]SQD78431.1 conserved protein of unknown function [Moritella yayanosii]
MRKVILLTSCFMLSCGFYTTVSANETIPVNIYKQKDMLEMEQYQKFIPSGFVPVYQADGSMDNTSVSLVRYQPQANSQLMLQQQHVSFVLDLQGKLMGFNRLIPDFSMNAGTLPDPDESRVLAIEFLEKYAPDLVKDMDVKWIKPHDEIIYQNNKKMTLTGMKVKCRNKSDGRYFWVVIAQDRSVMTFERDIVWDFFRAGRQTEKWLHDSWLTNKI